MEGQQMPQKKGGKGGLVLGIINLLLILGLGAGVGFAIFLGLANSSDTSGSLTSAPNGVQSSALSNLYEEVNPSVVYLFTEDSKLVLDEYGQIQYQKSGSLGSGFVYDSDGYIVTNAHVIADTLGTKVFTSVQVAFPATNKTYVAKVLAADPLNDIAIVKIQERNLPTVEFGNIDEVKVGDPVFAVGSPGGSNDITGNLKNTMTSGIVSGLNREFGILGLGNALYLQGQIPETVPSLAHNDLIQTDAAINHGNSGGPLFNSRGQVIGVNTLGETSDGQQNLGFAVPVDTVKRIADDVKESDELTAPYIGLATLSVDEISSRTYGFKVDEGAMVYIILPNSPAANANLKPLDIITAVNGVDVSTSTEYEEELLKVDAGDEVELEVNSNGARNTVKIKTIKTPFLKGI